VNTSADILRNTSAGMLANTSADILRNTSAGMLGFASASGGLQCHRSGRFNHGTRDFVASPDLGIGGRGTDE